MNDLPFITYSVGIGKTFPEATRALFTAKERKATAAPLDNIVVYQGTPLPDSPLTSSNAQSFLRVRSALESAKISEPILQDHDALLRDPRTALLNKLGYEVALLDFPNGPAERAYVLFDGNNMHGHNEQYGFDIVTGQLDIAGRSIGAFINSLRIKPDRRRSEDPHYISERRHDSHDRRAHPLITDALAHRVNGDGGDEFLVVLAGADVNIAQSVAKRALTAMYKAQLGQIEP